MAALRLIVACLLCLAFAGTSAAPARAAAKACATPAACKTAAKCAKTKSKSKACRKAKTRCAAAKRKLTLRKCAVKKPTSAPRPAAPRVTAPVTPIRAPAVPSPRPLPVPPAPAAPPAATPITVPAPAPVVAPAPAAEVDPVPEREPTPEPEADPTPAPEADPVSETKPTPDPAPTKRVQHFGFNDQAANWGVASAEDDAALTARAGADVARITFDWRWAEPYEDKWDFAPYDRIYKAMKAKGVRPVWTVLFAPHWAWDPAIECDQWKRDCTFPPHPSHDEDFRDMLKVLVKRYPDSAGIEIWNEPNLYWFWRPAPNPQRYAELLKQAYTTIKSVDPDMPVISAGLLNLVTTGGRDIAMRDFLKGIYAAGAGESMDAIGVHLYPLLDPFRDWIAKGLKDARDVRNWWGTDKDKPIWVTEWGVSTTETNAAYLTTERQQADQLVEGHRRLAAMDDVDAIMVHTLVEPDRDGRERGFGLVRPDLTPKPAYCALAAELGKPRACG
jgi:hypothetical protein